MKALAAAWVADTGAWQASGDRSAAHHLARTTGTAFGQAADTIQTARRLENLPEVGAAAQGRLSPQQAAAVADAASADPSAVRDLLDTGDPFLAPVVTVGQQVVGVAHLGQRPTAHQQTALEWLYPTCAAEGCLPAPGSRTITGSTGPRATSPSSISSTGCARTTTT